MGVGGCLFVGTSKEEQEIHKNSAQGAMKVSSNCNWLAFAVCATQHESYKRAVFLWTRHGKFNEMNTWIVFKMQMHDVLDVFVPSRFNHFKHF